MLALGTHEPHFKVLREDVFFQDKNTCRICNKPGHYAAQCTGKQGYEVDVLLQAINKKSKQTRMQVAWNLHQRKTVHPSLTCSFTLTSSENTSRMRSSLTYRVSNGIWSGRLMITSFYASLSATISYPIFRRWKSEKARSIHSACFGKSVCLQWADI